MIFLVFAILAVFIASYFYRYGRKELRRMESNYPSCHISYLVNIELLRVFAQKSLGRGQHNFAFFNNISLVIDGCTYHFDHIIVARQGIFILEIRNESGKLKYSRKEGLKRATESGMECTFCSLSENITLNQTLANFVGLESAEHVHTLYVFGNHARFLSLFPKRAVTIKQIKPCIASRQAVLNERTVLEISGLLRYSRIRQSEDEIYMPYKNRRN